MANHLAGQTSPYLLQHQHNPVDWYPWGPEALAKAADEDKPIFLSIGYSACHWCHVMEHESFEDPRIAELLNRDFVSIKVDREERPDLDQIYMNAVQLMTGRGGWPMSVFLTPDLRPFYGGTYWPPQPKMGMPGFGQVLEAVRQAWTERRGQAEEQAEKLTDLLRDVAAGSADSTAADLDGDLLQQAGRQLESVFDHQHGGFGSAPKFPHCMDLQVLLRLWSRTGQEAYLEMVRRNLDKMAAGGIHDHLAGGFARYSVDAKWLVPHFEKMLYDNALLAGIYLDAFLATGEGDYAQTVRRTLDYVLAYMTDESGGFHSSEDADSEGVEGKFYVWTPAEIIQVLGEERGERFCYVYDVTDQGNFEHGQSILNLPKTIQQCATLKGWDYDQLVEELAESRSLLLLERDRRVRPGKDDKILVSWNALMIDSMARAAGPLEDERYLDAAQRAARFLLTQLRDENGRMLHCWRLGQASLAGYLDDYAYLINALVTLYESTFLESWIDEAMSLTAILIERFADPHGGAFYFTADDHERLITRNKDLHDSSVPSGNSMAATVLLRLGQLCGRDDLVRAAEGILQASLPLIKRSASAAGQMLVAIDFHLGPTPQIVMVGDPHQPETAELLAAIQRRYLPRRVLACRDPQGDEPFSPHLDPLLAGKLDAEQPALFVCHNFSCQAPAYGAKAVRQRIDSGF